MFKYGNKVKVIKDIEGEGFYLCAEGIVLNRTKREDNGAPLNNYRYTIKTKSGQELNFNEDELEKI